MPDGHAAAGRRAYQAGLRALRAQMGFQSSPQQNWKHQTGSDFTPPRSDGRRERRLKLPPPDRQRPRGVVFSILEITTGRCRDWGRDVPVIDRNMAVFTSSWPGRGHRDHGLKFPAGFLRFPCRGAVGIGLAALVAPHGPRTSWASLEQQARHPFPSLRMPGGCHVTLRAASIGEALCSLASSAMPNSGKTPGGFPFPAGRHFFKEYPHAPR